MKLLLTIIGLVATSFVIAPPQDEGSAITQHPNSEIWTKHLRQKETTELLSSGVPDRYHYLYSFYSDIDDVDIRKALPFTKIGLSRTHGQSPAFVAEFSATGEATYTGVAYTRLLGKHRSTIELHEFGRICWAIERLKLTDPQPKPRSAINETSAMKLTLTLQSGKIVELTDHGNPSSIELLLVSTLIDRTADEKDWKK